jgi:hypothetical protein
MKRSMCGIALLAVATALWSCNGDPTGSIRDSGQKILADPTSVFVAQGESKFVTVALVDGQGNQLAAEFTPQNVGPGITVVRDTTFLHTTTGTPIQTSARFIVTATGPAATSFDVVSGGTSATVPVKVLPIDVAAAFSNPTPAANEAVTLTLTGFLFTPTSFVVIGADTAIVLSHAADETSISIMPTPGATGAVTIGNVEVTYLPGTPVTLPTAATLTVAALAGPLPGTAAPGTAPAFPVPAAGLTSALFDIPDFAATIDHFYRLDVPEAGDYTITVDWTLGSDIDVVVCTDITCSAFNPQFGAATGNKPESAVFTLTAGTQVLLVEDFGANAAGAQIKITMSH